MAQIRTLLVGCLGLLMVGAGGRGVDWDRGVLRPIGPQATKPADPTGPVPPASVKRQRAAPPIEHGDEDDQPAGACWIARVSGRSPSCLCSAGSVEDLMAPDFMRGLLTSWRDAGRLSAWEWQERMQEVDAACEWPSP